MKILALLAAALAAIPAALSDQGIIYFLTLIMVLAIFAIGYDIVFGQTGLLSFGHAAFFGLGSYIFAFLAMKSASLGLPAIFLAGVGGAILAVLVAAIALRLAGIYFSLMTLASAELLFYAASSPLRWLTGGEEGLVGVPRPALYGIDFYNDNYFYLLVLAFFIGGLAASRTLRASPLGQAMRAVKVNEIRADQLGFNVNRIKLAAFAISGFYSGVAGALLGALMQFVNPQGLHWSTSGDIVIMTLLGGAGTLYGPAIGVGVFEVLKETLSAYTVHFYGLVGIIFILTTIYMPSGIHGALEAMAARWLARDGGKDPARQPKSVLNEGRGSGGGGMTAALRCVDVSVRFGALTAVDGVSLLFSGGGIHSVIGPNGAGKTTFINVLSGRQKPTHGRVLLGDRDITNCSAHERARQGIGRSFQITKVFSGMTVFENLRLARQAAAFRLQPFWSSVDTYRELSGRAEAMMEEIGLARLRNQPAEELSHGDQRALELGITLMTDPEILLLDEPLAGVGEKEIEQTMDAIVRASQGRTVLLIEHNIDVVMRVSRRIVVLNQGAVLASGTPEEIRNDPAVREAYLGDGRDATSA